MGEGVRKKSNMKYRAKHVNGRENARFGFHSKHGSRLPPTYESRMYDGCRKVTHAINEILTHANVPSMTDDQRSAVKVYLRDAVVLGEYTIEDLKAIAEQASEADELVQWLCHAVTI